ncbi:unnamed protein product [Nesidiocoris tenuis]|uniref:Protein kinase domain-containing protein n=1 Tax=Nesidiocoris tenuis TaxID=355587 RepID=A0A6H5GTE4_9HEMI|nr:unnamed protein product [Nesidiocoris tenuis]
MLMATKSDRKDKPKPPELPPKTMMRLVRGLCLGMEHISNHRLVHRDLAARNCLVSSDLSVKVSLSALSKDVYRKEYFLHRNKLLPIRWMPPEGVGEDDYSSKSDVFSFGVTVWEIFARGDLPHSGRSDQEVLSGLADSGETLILRNVKYLKYTYLASLCRYRSSRCFNNSLRNQKSNEAIPQIGDYFPRFAYKYTLALPDNRVPICVDWRKPILTICAQRKIFGRNVARLEKAIENNDILTLVKVGILISEMREPTLNSIERATRGCAMWRVVVVIWRVVMVAAAAAVVFGRWAAVRVLLAHMVVAGHMVPAHMMLVVVGLVVVVMAAVVVILVLRRTTVAVATRAATAAAHHRRVSRLGRVHVARRLQIVLLVVALTISVQSRPPSRTVHTCHQIEC